jgi:hypothetical protein
MTLIAPAAAERGRTPHPGVTGPAFLPAAAALSVALVLAGTIALLQRALPGSPERVVMVTVAGLAVLLLAGPCVYLARLRGRALPSTAGLLFVAGSSIVLLAVYFYWVSWYVNFPADILIWSESDFVNDIVKFQTGYPLYSPQVNNDSFNYVPGPQLLTYLIAWLAGRAGSIPFYRAIQVGYTAVAAFLGLLCYRRLMGHATRSAGTPLFLNPRLAWLWNAFAYAILLLAATNFIANRFTYNLHGDALAQLANLAAFYLLLVYIDTRDRRVLALMALVPPVGFLVKQNLVVWALLYTIFLLVWHRDWKRALVFATSTGALVAAVLGACYAIWGEPFFYWTVYVLSARAVSPLRSFQHALDCWPYFAAGLLGGAASLRSIKFGPLAGAWLVWLTLITVEAYTSGIAWMLNHIGPGTLVATVWFLAGLALLWNRAAETWKAGFAGDWIAAGAASVSLVLLFTGMGLMRIPIQPISNDAYRYVHDIEAQFQGQPADRILLDAGSWNYTRARVVMGDRAPSIGERGYSSTGDFSGILARIASHRYSKILVRDFYEPDFWYEHFTWVKPSGIRQALLSHYREIGHIRAAAPPVSLRDRAEDPHLFGEITILEPKPPE